MQAFEIVYNDTEDRVALGWPGGKVAVHRIEPDGAPGELVAEVVRHKATIVCLGYCSHGLASVSEDGDWAISDAETGAVKLSGSVGGEYVRGSISPDGGALFLFSYLDGDSVAFRVRCDDGSQTRGPDVDEALSVTSRVFALSDDVALYHFIGDDWDDEDDEDDVTREGLLVVNFGDGTVTRRAFEKGPTSDFDSETRLMQIDARAGIGIRPDYENVEIIELDGGKRALLRAEIFDIETLETRARPVVLRWPVEHLVHTAAALATAEPGSEEFIEGQDWYVRWLCSAQFAGDHVWVGVQRGIIRRLGLDDEAAAATPILHGGGPSGGGFTLDDVFARNLINNYTLGVSPSGRFVGFGNPNDFFCVDDLDLTAELAIKLPERATTGPVTEAPGRVDFAGDRLVVFDRAHTMFFADARTGEPSETIDLPEHYGDATRACVSPGGRRLAIAVSGGSALLYDFEAAELVELPVPPHTISAHFTSDSRLYMAHHNGAVVAFDFELEDVVAHRADDEGYPEEMLEDMDPDELAFMKSMAVFEQRYDCYAAVVFQRGEHDWVGVIDENDELQLYKSERGTLAIADGPSINVAGSRLAAGDGWIAATNGSSLAVVDLESEKVVETLSFEGELRLVHTGARSGALYVFDDRLGQLIRVADPRQPGRDVVFEYAGPSVGRIAVSEATGRVALVTASGEIELRDLEDGAVVATLRVAPRGKDTRELIRG